MQQTTTESSEIKRLHITPFDPSLLPSVLPASIRPLASEISFHSIPTFPENNYGYVSLPAMEADKIKKKLNGSILKGKKFKVEAARPSKRRREDDGGEAVEETPKSDKKSKKRKPTENVVEGYELPSDRHVKRGWTESTAAKEKRRTEEKRKKGKGEKKAKSQAKSKYTEKSECLFQAKLPPNRASIGEKKDKASKKKKKNKDPLQTTVHEFENTVTYPSFLRAEGEDTAPVSQFEEGKGWVDGSGNVKEKPSDRVRTEQHKPGQLPGAKEKRPSLKRDQGKAKKGTTSTESTSESEDWTSSDASSSSSDSEDDDDSGSSSASETSKASTAGNKHPAAQSNAAEDEANSSSSESDSETSVKSNESPTEPANEPSASEVHPLEALFKRPAPGTADKAPEPEPTAQFSFFGQGDVDSDEEMEETAGAVEPSEAPQTPFTKKDLQSRGLRSAAPTPDTALVNRNIKWDSEENDSAEDANASINTPLRKFGAAENAESDFAKWFWENRGDNNRAWKKRRRDAAKEQRQRENRSKGMKGKS